MTAQTAIDTAEHFRARFSTARYCTFSCYTALLVLFAGLNLLRQEGSVSTWLMQTLPLLVVLPGLLQNKHRSYSWLCFVILIYFTAYVVEVMSPLFVWSDALALALSVVIFIAAMLASRWLQRWQYHAAQASGTVAQAAQNSRQNGRQ